MSNIDVTVILPFLNEGDNLINTSKRLDRFFETSGLTGEVIFIDDGSTDNSFKIACEGKYSNFIAKVVKLSRNFGTHAALRAGISKAEGDFVTFLYADLQDPLELIELLFKKSLEGKDIVWAVRNKISTGFFKNIFTRIYAVLMRKFVSPGFPSQGMDVVMFSSRVNNILKARVEANSSLFLQIFTMGFKQEFVEYEKKERAVGKSKWTLAKKIKLFIDSFVAFSYAPIRFVSVTGIILAVLGIIWGVVIVLRAIFWGDLIAGWPTLIFILMIGFGITNISLGIIAEYLWRTLDSSRGRDVFIIDEYRKIESEE